ncbi:Frag1/DRAM/Sfk1 family protein [Scedosporium apiospermum]|uniref:Frag1/DRAM/Sfk1 family protein n=1 Tax=Pseudallescheria apiosperma TaxID=563466 RepID=A0A084FXB3_PSEDA|nr:Frag1/DRAM/Sfk1 family protein [Scedosporium apiospermum]KEZ39725.1 Frag1/DRAM/Sfk1 family protein [Scedosporium apiospermum]
MRVRFSYWVLPIISGVVWLATLLGLLLEWAVDEHKKRYPSMSPYATIPFISNIGAHEMKPLFIAGCVITTVFLDLSFASDWWLRHRGRLVPNTTVGEKVFSGLSIVFAIIGTVGLIMLSIFDTANHQRLHNIFLGLFIGGYLISAIFICLEYRRLRRNHREHRILRTSFHIKLGFVLLELALIISFAVCSRIKKRNAAAVLEWVIAFIFSAYVFSFIVDLWPAMHTKPERGSRVRRRDLGMPNGDNNSGAAVCPSSSGSTQLRDWTPMEMEEARHDTVPVQPRQAHMNRVSDNF